MGSTVATTLRSSIIAALGVSGTAGAQDAANSAAPNVEEIVVTGSSLRGVAPVGSNLVTIGRDEIENTGAQTVQQILKTVPSIVGLQSAGQAAYGSFDGAGTNAPTIHGLGASASNSTLILLNGHRMPVSGINHVLADPEHRCSARARARRSARGRRFVGLRLRCRRGRRQFHYAPQRRRLRSVASDRRGRTPMERSTLGCSVEPLGTAARCSSHTTIPIATTSRPSTATMCGRTKRRAAAGISRRTGAAPRASPPEAAQTYYTPYTAAGVIAGDCDPSFHADLLASETRHSIFATIQQNVSDRLTLTGDLIYSNARTIKPCRAATRARRCSAPVLPTPGKSVRSSVLPTGCSARHVVDCRQFQRVMLCSAPALTSRATLNGLRAFRRRLRSSAIPGRSTPASWSVWTSRGNRISASSASRASTLRSTARPTAAAAPLRRRYRARRRSCSTRL